VSARSYILHFCLQCSGGILSTSIFSTFASNDNERFQNVKLRNVQSVQVSLRLRPTGSTHLRPLVTRKPCFFLLSLNKVECNDEWKILSKLKNVELSWTGPNGTFGSGYVSTSRDDPEDTQLQSQLNRRRGTCLHCRNILPWHRLHWKIVGTHWHINLLNELFNFQSQQTIFLFSLFLVYSLGQLMEVGIFMTPSI